MMTHGDLRLLLALMLVGAYGGAGGWLAARITEELMKRRSWSPYKASAFVLLLGAVATAIFWSTIMHLFPELFTN